LVATSIQNLGVLWIMHTTWLLSVSLCVFVPLALIGSLINMLSSWCIWTIIHRLQYPKSTQHLLQANRLVTQNSNKRRIGATPYFLTKSKQATEFACLDSALFGFLRRPYWSPLGFHPINVLFNHVDHRDSCKFKFNTDTFPDNFEFLPGLQTVEFSLTPRFDKYFGRHWFGSVGFYHCNKCTVQMNLEAIHSPPKSRPVMHSLGLERTVLVNQSEVETLNSVVLACNMARSFCSPMDT
jgi:hypothetical protein